MSYFAVEDFKAGLDVRRSPFTSVAGTLQKLVNAHITRGGDIERRKAFVDQGALATTFDLASDIDGKVVFGSDLTPGGVLPAGVRYQRLVAPTGAAMTGVQVARQYGGKLYVIANYDDGSQWHFYDGVLVSDWGGGIVTSAMITNDDIAEHLRGLVDGDDEYAATRVGSTVEIVGPIGVDYSVATTTENVAGGVDDQDMSVALIDEAVVEIAPAQAFAEFAILSGSVAAPNTIDKVRVDVAGVYTELLAAPVAFTTSPEYTAAAVAAAINTGTGSHGYDAEAKYGKVFVYAPGVDGSGANGRILEVKATGDIVLYNGSFTIAAGTASSGVNTVSSVKANGLEILGVAVDWAGSNAQTAEAVAAQICAYASVPKFNARAEGAVVFVSPETVRSDDATAITLAATSTGDVEFGAGGTPQVVDQYPDYGSTTGCVAVNMLVIERERGIVPAGTVVADEWLLRGDGTWGQVDFSREKEETGVRLVANDMAMLDCSVSAPIQTEAGFILAPDMFGHWMPRWLGAEPRKATRKMVIDIARLGTILVQHISLVSERDAEIDHVFLASEDGLRWWGHHNRKAVDF